MEQVDRRQAGRVAFAQRVEYFCWDRPKTGRATEISADGLFLHTEDVLPEGSMMTLRLRLPGAERAFTVLGQVARVVLGGLAQSPGMGIRFLDIRPGDRDRIAEYVAICPRPLARGLGLQATTARARSTGVGALTASSPPSYPSRP